MRSRDIIRFAVLCVVFFAVLSYCKNVSAADPDLIEAIQVAASEHGVSAERMMDVAWCESRLGTFSSGDHGHSHGPFMLNDASTGLLHHFRFVGYDNPYSYRQASDYFARVMTGEFTRDRATIRVFGPNVRASRWSCW